MNPYTIQIEDVLIRRATMEDAPEIANVHLNSWREAYRGLLPQDFLDQMPLSFKGRMKSWREAMTEDHMSIFVAEAKSGIVGFSVVALAREVSMKEHGELGAIYLLEKFKGKKIGSALLKLGMQQLTEWNFDKAYCWVLEGNPTIQFYEKSGATFNGMIKGNVIGGKKVNELAYEWKDLSRF